MGIMPVAMSPVTLCQELRKPRRGGVMIGADGDPTPTWIRSTVRTNCHRLLKGPKSAPIYSLKVDQAKRLKELELENGRLRKAVSDLALDKLTPQEAASGNF